MASATVKSAPTHPISGRGTITSRTKRSPKAITDAISPRSSASMASDASARSATARSSSSDTTGTSPRSERGRRRPAIDTRPSTNHRSGRTIDRRDTTMADPITTRSSDRRATVRGSTSARRNPAPSSADTAITAHPVPDRSATTTARIPAADIRQPMTRSRTMPRERTRSSSSVGSTPARPGSPSRSSWSTSRSTNTSARDRRICKIPVSTTTRRPEATVRVATSTRHTPRLMTRLFRGGLDGPVPARA